MPKKVALEKARLSDLELDRIDKLRGQGREPKFIRTTMNRARAIRKLSPVSKTSLYDYLKGSTYARDADENRGPTSIFGRKHFAVYDSIRKSLQKEAENEWTVTWDDIAVRGQAELRKRKLIKRTQDGLSAETLRKRMRDELGVGNRPAPKHITRTADDEQRRYRQSTTWDRQPASFWNDGVTYIDNKKFLRPRNAADRKRMRQSRVTYHLRKPNERTNPMYA